MNDCQCGRQSIHHHHHRRRLKSAAAIQNLLKQVGGPLVNALQRVSPTSLGIPSPGKLALLLLLAACARTPAAAPAIVIAPTVPVTAVTPTPAHLNTPTPPPPATNTPPHPLTSTPAHPLPPSLQNPLDAKIAQAARAAQASFRLLDDGNTGIWQYDEGLFVHPIALEVAGDAAYLLDGGRVLALNLAQPTPPELLLAPGDRVEDVPVIEPLDLTLTADSLLVLDRSGDVYRYELAAQTWSLVRYDRPIGQTSSHYYVALDDGVLVEPSYNFAMQFSPGQPDRFWPLPDGTRPVDVSAWLTQTAVLLQDAATLTATTRLYADATQVETFQPTVEMRQPRQVVMTDTAVYVLDTAGRRLLTLHPQTGVLLTVTQLPPVSAFAVDGPRLILAGRNQLYFVDEPARRQTISGGPVFEGSAPHDTAVWSKLGPFLIPVQGSQAGLRDLQLPGAPRHYRLGVHEGIDFYWAAGTPVLAAMDGVVIRATHEYEQPDEIVFGRWWQKIREEGASTAEALDFYRGMQVWIEHPDGTVARYVHLSEIEEAVVVGTAVTAGQRIGLVGNTGSPLSVSSATEDAHLHFELWLNGHYLGQFLRPVEVRELVAALFRNP
ncbi:MAG TPA: M23 family metallopeptidase [Chloroflexota bacterium]|nr:M23 family metallopeptidase [Chloroflexota bacterium]